MKHLSRLFLLVSIAMLCAVPALAVGNGTSTDVAPPGIFAALSHQFDTAAIVALCSAVASVALAFSKYLPGYATKANVVVVVATTVGAAVGALGPQAGAVAILVACFGALVGYNRSGARAAAKVDA